MCKRIHLVIDFVFLWFTNLSYFSSTYLALFNSFYLDPQKSEDSDSGLTVEYKPSSSVVIPEYIAVPVNNHSSF